MLDMLLDGLNSDELLKLLKEKTKNRNVMYFLWHSLCCTDASNHKPL